MEWGFSSHSKDTDAAEPWCERLSHERDIVHVVRICLDEDVFGAIQLLDTTERMRASRFVFEDDRRRFIIAHAWVRLVLSRWLACDPDRLRFKAGQHGKPYLDGSAEPMHFNLSHSAERALLALRVDRPVGVDIERHPAVAPMEVAPHVFAREEVMLLERLDDAERIATFCRGWTRKEAVSKAIGGGLSVPLNAVAVGLDDEGASQAFEWCAVGSDLGPGWRVVTLAAERGYQAAVASSAGEWRVREWDLVRRHQAPNRRA